MTLGFGLLSGIRWSSSVTPKQKAFVQNFSYSLAQLKVFKSNHRFLLCVYNTHFLNASFFLSILLYCGGKRLVNQTILGARPLKFCFPALPDAKQHYFKRFFKNSSLILFFSSVIH